MKLSIEKRKALYKAVAEPIVQARLAAQKLPISYDDRQAVDILIADIEAEI